MRNIEGMRGLAVTSSLPSRPQAVSALPSWLFLLAVLLLFTVSGGMLWLVGFNYEGLTGSALTKIHPGTYLIVIVFAWTACRRGNPVGFLAEMAQRRPGALLLLVATLLLFIQIVSRAGPGMAGTLDTFMLPPLVVVLFAVSDPKTRGRTEAVIHVAMIANAALGLVEFASKTLVFPYRLDGQVFPEETRPAALQGHPLGSATITAFYTLALLSGGGTLSASQRAIVIVLELLAMVAFGGRAAMVTVLLVGAPYCLVLAHRALRSGRVPLIVLATSILALTLVPVMVVGLYAGGFFDAFLLRFQADGGSANARIEMIDVVSGIPFRDLLVGPDVGLVDSLRRQNGLELGIENPIVRTMLYQGAIVTVMLIVAVGLFLYEIARVSRSGMVLPMVAFVIIINTFESLASKTTMLAKFAVMMLVLFRPLARSRRSRDDAEMSRSVATGFRPLLRWSRAGRWRPRGLVGVPVRQRPRAASSAPVLDIRLGEPHVEPIDL